MRHDVSILLDLGSHDLAVLDYIMPSPPGSIRARRLGSRAGEAKHNVEITLSYDDRSEARVHVSWVTPTKTRRIFVEGSRASLLVDDVALPHQVQTRHRDGDVSTLQCETSEPLATLIDEFAQAIDRGHAPLSDGDCGVRVMTQLEAAQRSLEDEGAPVSLEVEVARR